VDYRILGPLEVSDPEAAITLGGAKQRALLAILLIHANQVVSTDRLIGALWGDEPPANDVNALQVTVSALRRALGRGRPGPFGQVLVTRTPGYLLRVGEDELDLYRFERLASEGRQALQQGASDRAADRFAEALELWSGPPLADFTYESFARTEIERLEERRQSVLEGRIVADLECGRHRPLVAELEALCREHPLRERLRALLMLALYRSGRQAEAIRVYQETKDVLREELGMDPGPELRELETAILNQDPSLNFHGPERVPGDVNSRDLAAPVLIVSLVEDRPEQLPWVAGAIAGANPQSELILARLLVPDDAEQDLASVAASLEELRAKLSADGVAARAAAFTSADPGEDILRLATDNSAGLVLLDGGELLDELGQSPFLDRILNDIPSDLGILVRADRPLPGTVRDPVLVPFGGAEHEWAALQFGAGIARALEVPVRLLGVQARREKEQRDASRLLANASMVLQRTMGVSAQPVLTDPGPDAVIDQAKDASLLVIGLSDRWKEEGIGATRASLAGAVPIPSILLRRAPGGTATHLPRDLTKFPWSRT
jgi:DNA-binding SARP family transcriptional activator